MTRLQRTTVLDFCWIAKRLMLGLSVGVPDPKAGLENAHVWNKFSVVYYASVSSDLFPLINECVFVCLFVCLLFCCEM